MYLNREFAGWLRNPLVVIPPLVLILVLGWQQYTFAGRDLSLPTDANLMPGGVFNEFGENGLPLGWQAHADGELNANAYAAPGYAAGKTLVLTISGYQDGDLNVTSPEVAVVPNRTYLFKGYFASTVPFSLSIKKFAADGSSTLTDVQSYQTTNGQWTTASDAFKPTQNVADIQFVFRAYGNGMLQLNSFYLEPMQHVYVTGDPAGTNLIPNSQLNATNSSNPDMWSTYQTGLNNTSFAYLQDNAGPYVQVKVSDYQNGEGKWQYPPQTVAPHQRYQFSVSYKSDVSVPIIAEYVLQGGSRSYQTVTELPPADDWTNATELFETPSGATNMFVSLPLQHNGTVSSRNYQLVNATKADSNHWPGPVVSLTFDSGRQSQYANAEPLLKQYGDKATFYINPATIETNGFMNAKELSVLSSSGNEIASRGYNPDDMTALNDSALDYQLHEGRDYLRSAGYTVSDFSVPYGRSDSEVQYYAREYYNTLRGTDSGINTWQNFNPYNLKVLNISSATTELILQSALSTAKSEHGWLILVYQGIGETSSSTPSSSTITKAQFSQELDLIKKSGIPVKPISTVVKEIGRQG